MHVCAYLPANVHVCKVEVMVTCQVSSPLFSIYLKEIFIIYLLMSMHMSLKVYVCAAKARRCLRK